ncbi:hypothetical protein AFLA_004016 [Aspergillus flavus NRRL3357]|nr:hypothetical protein AFLA_004016 [Aspergillus flavus NRRL3357]
MTERSFLGKFGILETVIDDDYCLLFMGSLGTKGYGGRFLNPSSQSSLVSLCGVRTTVESCHIREIIKEEAITSPEKSHGLPSNDQGNDCRSSESHSGTFSPWSCCHMGSKTVVAFQPHDPDHPNNWSKFWKIFVLVTGANEVMNSTVGSSVTGGATKAIAQEFNVTNQQILVLPISMFLVGYILGPLLWGPLSEAQGRSKVVSILLIFMLLDGMAASAPIAIVGGIYADIEADPTARGRLMAYYMTATTIGPVLGPLASGFLVSYGWRSCFWFGLAYAGISLPMALLMPETYAPIILQRRAKRLRKETGNSNIISPLELGSRDFKRTLAISLARPLRMLFYEPITSCSCLYLALTYAIFYLYFQAYPLVFQGIYGMGPAKSGLCFLPIGVGAVVGCVIFMCFSQRPLVDSRIVGDSVRGGILVEFHGHGELHGGRLRDVLC